MKKIILIFALFVFAVTSCSKWLDVEPSSVVKEDEMFEDDKGFRNALIGCYTEMTSTSLWGGNLSFNFLEILGQTYEIYGTTSTYYYASNYNYASSGVKSTIQAIWKQAYYVIANANNIIKNIEGKETGFFEDERYHNLIKGECLAIRAFVHFEMLRLFGDSPAYSTSTLAIPYVDEVTKETVAQLTVKQAAERCIADLKEAAELLYTVDPISPYFDVYTEASVTNPSEDLYISDGGFMLQRLDRLNYFAVQATLARIYMYMGDTDNAYKYAMETIANTELTEKGLSQRLYVSSNVFRLYCDNLTEYSNTCFSSDVSDAAQLKVPEEDLNEIYETGVYGSIDTRKGSYFDYYEGTTDIFCQKFLPAYVSYPPQVAYIQPLTGAEMAYIIAETAPVVDDRLTYINKVRNTYGITSTYNLSVESDLESEIEKEYRKRLICDGQMFYYYKRKFETIPGAGDIENLRKVYNMLDYLPDTDLSVGGLVGPGLN